MHEAGLVTGAQDLAPGKVAYTFALGTQRLYDWIDHNPGNLSCIPVDQTNLPHLIMRNDQVVSINNTTQVDQVGGLGVRRPARHQRLRRAAAVRPGAPACRRGGRSFICLASTFEKNGGARQPPDRPVSSPATS
ncbi:MAG: acetyl-CoA hydrolase/transferase C-terminal domain-containing protein [Nocardioidaceae bacterium]